jgi:16S rRNA (adenine1518-N6/adenine1519-N6)-dimethyltransferase
MSEHRTHKAKKSLGQNFLNSPKALRQIIEASHLTEKDLVLEVGPGKGALTEKLLETGATVLAIEKDRELIPYLTEKFAHYIKAKKFTLVEADILFLNSAKIKKECKPVKVLRMYKKPKSYGLTV